MEELATLIDGLSSLAWGDGADTTETVVPPQATADRAALPQATTTTSPVPNGGPVTALVVGHAVLADALTGEAAAAGESSVECERLDGPAGALDLARALAPDVCLIDADLPGTDEMASALVDDPLTEPVPLVVVGTFPTPEHAAKWLALGVARVLAKPSSPDAIREACLSAIGDSQRSPRPEPLGEVSLDELGARLAEELRRGLCDAAGAEARGVKIPMGDGSDVLAALWSAVARIREVATIRSKGVVRFSARGPAGAIPVASWAADARLPGARDGQEPTETTRLDGRTIVVADDDPAVTWFLSGVLRAAGATVLEAHDGEAALALAYRASPDLVVSDVLMPKLDGFALCHALKRDVALRDVPVILLSWKEDLLQRVRELGAGADGYLRKEASAAIVLSRVREVLRPRTRVEARLQGGGEVRGRLDGLTVRTLLTLVSRERPDARVTVRDASFLYEVELRDGEPRRATRTAPDGSFDRGEPVLASMLGVGAGRFVVGAAEGTLKGGLVGSLSEQLRPLIARARAAQKLLSGASLLETSRVELDGDAMATYLAASPGTTREIVARLAEGLAPRQLALRGGFGARVVEDVLADAAAHGAVKKVIGPEGDDVLPAAIARETGFLVRGVTRSILPPAEREAPYAQLTPSPLAPLPIILDAPSAPPPVASASPPPAATQPSPSVPLALTAKPLLVAEGTDSPADVAPRPDAASEPEPEASKPPSGSSIEAALMAVPSEVRLVEEDSPPSIAEIARSSMPPPPAEAESGPVSSRPAPTSSARRPLFSDPSPPPAPVRDREPERASKSSSSSGWLWAGAVLAAAVAGTYYFVQDTPPPAAPATPSTHVSVAPPPPASAPPVATSAAAPVPTPSGSSDEPPPPNAPVSEDLPLAAGDTVPDGQGMIEVVAGRRDEILVDRLEVGRGPKVRVPVPAGTHDVRARRKGEEQPLVVVVKAGRRTRVDLRGPWKRLYAAPYEPRVGGTSPRAVTSRTIARALAVPALALAVAGCPSSRSDTVPEVDAGKTPRPVGSPAAPHGARVPRTFDIVSNLSRCQTRHRGVLLDLGSPGVEGLEGWRLSEVSGVSNVEREGATWGRVSARSLSYRFQLDEPTPVFVAARVRGMASRAATASIDGKVVGTLSFGRNQTRVVATAPSSTTLAAGQHVLSLRFAGAGRESVDPLAEIDWLRVGIADEDPSAFAAPTLRDISQNVALSGTPHRAIAIRAPGSVRCPIGVPHEARLRLSVGVQGGGEAQAEVRVLRDGQTPSIVWGGRILGGDRSGWTEVDVPLTQFEGRIVSLELGASGATRGSRVVFGDPAVVGVEMPAVETPKARAVIVVVLSGIDPERLPPWAPDRPLPTFATLAREGAVFDAHRVPTTVPAGVMASILTGLSPTRHAVVDAYARLPGMLPTLATVARDASVRTAMFTSNPATSEAFGFQRGWDKFTVHYPNAPALGTAPIDELGAFVSEKGQIPERGLLGVAHARGIHPPYDMPPGEFSQLPPLDYSGPLDPRRAGQVIEKARQKKKLKWTDGDRARLSGMMDAAVVQTDRSLSNLIDSLRKAGLWNETLLVVTGDVAQAADPAILPFGESVDITEDNLRVPLYVHFPGGALAGARVPAPTTAMDIARTALAALNMDIPDTLGGVDLFALAERGITAAERPLVATLGDRYATRWTTLRLVGRDGSPPMLCDLSVDPHCEKDVRDAMPLATEALFRFTWDYEAAAFRAQGGRPRRDPATIDPETAAALAVWGR
jgi:CheY-like chemotaxis protein